MLCSDWVCPQYCSFADQNLVYKQALGRRDLSRAEFENGSAESTADI